MIVSDIYPTEAEFTTGTEGQSDYEHWAFTKSISQLSSVDGHTGTDIAEPYYMGYVPFEYVPDHAQITKLTTDSDNVYLTQIQNQNVNVPWFYMSACSNAVQYTTYPGGVLNYNLNDGNGWIAGGYYADGQTVCRFVNDLNVSTVNQYVATMTVSGWTTFDDTTVSTIVSSAVSVSFASMSDLLDFLNGETSIQFTMRNEAITTNFENIIMTHQYTDISYPDSPATLHYYISSFTLTSGAASFPPSAQTSVRNPMLTTGYFLQSDEEGISWISALYGLQGGGYKNYQSSMSCIVITTAYDLMGGTISEQPIRRVSNIGNYFIHNQNCYLFGGFKGQLERAIFQQNANVTYPLIVTSENFICSISTPYQQGVSNGLVQLERTYSKQEILNFLYQCCNFGSTAAYGFGASKYVPKFNSDDSPSWRLLNDLTAEEIETELRPWQRGRVTDNDFTPSSIPPYGPPTPPSEGEESGDKIPNQYRFFSGATNFITQYALTASQVSAFGRLLWTSWSDTLGDLTEMWKNFKLLFTGTDTGSIDIASVLSFIVSLRLYPFNLLSGGMSTFVIENSIKIGTGAYPLDISNVAKLLPTIIYVDGGYLDVPRPFNTFQDYDNMNVSVYLPYCGTVQLNPADVVGWRLRCKYAVDTQSGSCVAVVEKCTYGADDNTYYNVAVATGQIGCLLPVTATNSGQLAAQRISDASWAAGTIGGTFLSNISRGANAFSGSSEKGGIMSFARAAYSQMSDDLSLLTGVADKAASVLSRPSIACPSLSGGSGLASFIEPASVFLQMRYGIYDPPDNYDRSVGKISTDSTLLSHYTGFTVCENVDVTNLHCHNDEKAAIKAFLETGVYL